MTRQEVKARGRIGCTCGGIRIQPTRLRIHKSVWWFFVRGWLIRKVLLRKHNWDPRVPVLIHDEV